MSIWTILRYEYFPQINTLFVLLFGRILYAAFALSILICSIMLVRKKLSPSVRSWLWTLCIPALLIPFEHGIVTITRSLYTPNLELGPFLYLVESLHGMLPYFWLLGFFVFSIKVRKNRKNIMRILKLNKLYECAAYFYKGRSHIYLPPDFETIYTNAEREMLLAHENQHITQHDPLLYRFLQTIQCVFWFNPLVHMAVRFVRQDRELLCDERVVCNRSKREYGILLLREAQKNPTGHMLPGIVSDTGGVYERIAACVKPFSENRKPALVVAVIAAAMFVVGLMGFVKPIVNEPMDVRVFIVQDGDFSRLESAERFVVLNPDGATLDQQGLFEHAISIGLEPNQELSVNLNTYERMALIGEYTSSVGSQFTVGQLKTEDIFSSFYGTRSNLWSMLYKLL